MDDSRVHQLHETRLRRLCHREEVPDQQYLLGKIGMHIKLREDLHDRAARLIVRFIADYAYKFRMYMPEHLRGQSVTTVITDPKNNIKVVHAVRLACGHSTQWRDAADNMVTYQIDVEVKDAPEINMTLAEQMIEYASAWKGLTFLTLLAEVSRNVDKRRKQ